MTKEKEKLNNYIAKLGFSPEIAKELKRHINEYTLSVVESSVGRDLEVPYTDEESLATQKATGKRIINITRKITQTTE